MESVSGAERQTCRCLFSGFFVVVVAPPTHHRVSVCVKHWLPLWAISSCSLNWQNKPSVRELGCLLTIRGPLSSNQPSLTCLVFLRDARQPRSDGWILKFGQIEFWIQKSWRANWKKNAKVRMLICVDLHSTGFKWLTCFSLFKCAIQQSGGKF